MENLGVDKPNILSRSYKFGVDIVRICISSPKTQTISPLFKQLIRSGTSVGANIEEAQDAMSKADFIKTMNIALKEARETNYWLRILIDCGVLAKSEVEVIMDESKQIIKILISIVKNSKNNLS